MEFPIDPIRSPLLATGSKSRKSANLDCVSNATKSISKNIFILYEKEYIDEFFDETRFHVFIRLPYPLEISRYSSFHLGIDASSNFFFPFPREESAFFHFSPLHLSRNILVPVDLANRSTELIDTFTR